MKRLMLMDSPIYLGSFLAMAAVAMPLRSLEPIRAKPAPAPLAPLPLTRQQRRHAARRSAKAR